MNKAALKRLPKEKLLRIIDDLEKERDDLAKVYDELKSEHIKLMNERDALKVIKSVSGDSLAPLVLDCSGSSEHLSRVVKENSKKTKAQLLCMIAYKEALLDFDKDAKASEKTRADKLEDEIKKLHGDNSALNVELNRVHKQAVDYHEETKTVRKSRLEVLSALKESLSLLSAPSEKQDTKTLLKRVAEFL
jgi:hypothetical protein